MSLPSLSLNSLSPPHSQTPLQPRELFFTDARFIKSAFIDLEDLDESAQISRNEALLAALPPIKNEEEATLVRSLSETRKSVV